MVRLLSTLSSPTNTPTLPLILEFSEIVEINHTKFWESGEQGNRGSTGLVVNIPMYNNENYNSINNNPKTRTFPLKSPLLQATSNPLHYTTTITLHASQPSTSFSTSTTAKTPATTSTLNTLILFPNLFFDRVGWGNEASEGMWILDDTPPSVTITTPNNPTSQSNVTLVFAFRCDILMRL